ncbi:MAG: endo-1,4-beta-xylanase, partial [Desulfobacterales bacterium]|nr:endo-1,4-beta-xylanase [Desulfobacterales bacterium]
MQQRVLWVSLFFPFIVLLTANAIDRTEAEREILAEATKRTERVRQSEIEVVLRKGGGEPLAHTSVRFTHKRHLFQVGNTLHPLAWKWSQMHDPELFQRRFRDLYNMAVIPLHWAAYEPQPSKTQQALVENAFAWCEREGLPIKGHPLSWGYRNHLPEWVKSLSLPEAQAAQERRIRDMVTTFKGRVSIWDVVNEPIHMGPWACVMDPNCRFDPNDAQAMEDLATWVDRCFRWAHAADPEATLLLNEFGQIAHRDIREAFFRLVKMLQERGTPIEGIGIQAHNPRTEWFKPQDILDTLDLYAQLNLPIHISEFHPQSAGKEITGDWREGTWTKATQAEFTEQMLRLCFSHPAVVSFTWWGLSDRYIWLDGAGLIDEDYAPKLNYHRIRDLLQ